MLSEEILPVSSVKTGKFIKYAPFGILNYFWLFAEPPFLSTVYISSTQMRVCSSSGSGLQVVEDVEV
jgi:hypothetical protein